MDEDNNGRFPDNSAVEVRYPRSKQQEQGGWPAWPWLPGSILEQCGPDEWYVCVWRYASWPCCGTGGAHRAGRPAGIPITRAVTGTARRSGRGRHAARLYPVPA
jgi:hypothetical protein